MAHLRRRRIEFSERRANGQRSTSCSCTTRTASRVELNFDAAEAQGIGGDTAEKAAAREKR